MLSDRFPRPNTGESGWIAWRLSRTWLFADLPVDDASKGWSYTADVNFSGAAHSSAEWVVERPEVCSRTCSLTSLADFGSVTFSSASATSGGSSASISGYSDASIEMVNGSTVLAVPSALTANGAGFTDTWKAA